MVIANGDDPMIILKIVNGDEVGTWFMKKSSSDMEGSTEKQINKKR